MGDLLQSLKAGFDALPASLAGAHGLGAVRRAALEAALADGLPGARVEAWKYTSLRALAARDFAPAQATAVDPAVLAGIPAPRLVFVNGQHDAALSDLGGLPAGVELGPMSAVLAGDGPRAAAVVGQSFDRADEPFARLNTALALDGVRLSVAAGVVVGAPLHLVFLGSPADGDQAAHLRHLLELHAGAALAVVEHHLGTCAHRHLANHLVHVHLASRASFWSCSLPSRRVTWVRADSTAGTEESGPPGSTSA